MNSGKLTIPKEVAEAIESIKNVYNGQAYDISVISSNARHTPESAYGTIYQWITRNGIRTYFAVLVNGYEVEKSAEERLHEKFRSHAETASFYTGKSLDASESNQERYSSGYVRGVKDFADAYGIKIEGVGAD